MAHKHTCLDCDTAYDTGEFDCERDDDHDFGKCLVCAHDVAIDFNGAGHYYLNAPDGVGQIDLGECATDADLRCEVERAIEAGSGIEDWTDWQAEK